MPPRPSTAGIATALVVLPTLRCNSERHTSHPGSAQTWWHVRCPAAGSSSKFTAFPVPRRGPWTIKHAAFTPVLLSVLPQGGGKEGRREAAPSGGGSPEVAGRGGGGACGVVGTQAEDGARALATAALLWRRLPHVRQPGAPSESRGQTARALRGVGVNPPRPGPTNIPAEMQMRDACLVRALLKYRLASPAPLLCRQG